MIATRAVAGVMLLAFAAGTAAAPAKKPVPHKVAAAKPGAAKAAAPAALPDTAEVQVVRSAYQYAFPVYEMMRTRAGVVSRAEAAGVSGVNRLFVRKTLSDATTRDVTTPNNDTLYASAWLDLANGPVTLTVPDLPGRYNSAALMNIFTDNVAIVGTSSGGGGVFTIVGPNWQGKAPDSGKLIRITSNDAWLLVRVFVAGPKDLETAGAAIDAFKLEGGGAPVPTVAVPTPMPDPATFLAVVNEALARSRLAPKVELPPFDALTPDQQKLWTQAMPALRQELKGGFAKVGTEVDGWSYPGPGIGNFGDDEAGRAAVALGGLAALPRQEAIYLSAGRDAAGAPLDGSKSYSFRIPPHPPVGAFWSLTMYRVEADGRLFFFDNPLNRYALRSAERSIHYDDDGSIEVFLQPTRPGGERVVNWLPSPPGAYRLVWRAYLPKPELLDGSFKLPPVTPSRAVP